MWKLIGVMEVAFLHNSEEKHNQWRVLCQPITTVSTTIWRKKNVFARVESVLPPRQRRGAKSLGQNLMNLAKNCSPIRNVPRISPLVTISCFQRWNSLERRRFRYNDDIIAQRPKMIFGEKFVFRSNFKINLFKKLERNKQNKTRSIVL